MEDLLLQQKKKKNLIGHILHISVKITCPGGFYLNGAGCTLCPIGTYQPDPSTSSGVSACKACDPGKYCRHRSSAVAGDCEAGYYCPAGSTHPTSQVCPENYYCSSGSGSPTKCPHGSKSRKGSRTARDCISGCPIILNIYNL